MAELPPHAKALLALARDADDPPADAKVRVQRAALDAIAAGNHTLVGPPSTSSLPPTLRARFWGVATNKAGLFVSAVLLVGSSWAAYRVLTEPALPHREPIAMLESQPPQARPLVEPPDATAASERAEPTRADQVRPAGAKLGRHATKMSATEPQDTLAAEMLELLQASAEIEAGHVHEGLRLLERYRAHFAHPARAQESAGLAALAKCQLDPRAAEAEARTFLAAAPTSVLASRVQRACELEATP